MALNVPVHSAAAPLRAARGRKVGVKQAVWRLIPQFAGLAFSLLFIGSSVGQAAGRPAKPVSVQDRPAVSVGVIVNYAQVDRLELREAEGQAASIFADAGVRIGWRDYPQNGSPDQPHPESLCCDLFVRILPASMAFRRNSEANVLGESVIPPTTEAIEPGGMADVFYDRVHGVSWPQGPFASQVLGDAMAHEMGHLLLGPGHSPQGIMKDHWTTRDLQLASRGKLRFSPEQVRWLQHAARSFQQGQPVKFADGR